MSAHEHSYASREEAAFHAYYTREHAALQQACAFHVALLQSILGKARQIDIAKVEGRVKERGECVRKFARKYRAALEENATPYEIHHYITDLIGVRVVCLYEDELDKVAQIVQSHYDVMDVTDKVSAAQATASSFGYMGLHLDLRLNAAQAAGAPSAAIAHQPLELQVRTIIQDSWSVLDHKIKYKKSIPAELRRRINVLSALFELADREFRQIRDATAAELLRAPDETNQPEPDSRVSASGSELNAFTFLKIAQHFFKDHEFDARKVDLFVDDVRAWLPGMTRARLNSLMRETIGTVKRYKQFHEAQNPDSILTPFTVIRHCLYLGDKTVFRRALRTSAREAFEAWLQQD